MIFYPVTVKTIQTEFPKLLSLLREHSCLDVFEESTLSGFYVYLKRADKPASEMTREELKRRMRMYKNPQPYDVILESWEAWRYRGFHRGETSSAL